MARIAKEELERLKREVSVQRLAEARGVKLKRHGADLIGLCPFHEDWEPSLVISPRSNLWHCLGACQAGGSVIDWVIKAEGVSFRHAVELLRSDFPFLAAAKPLDAEQVVKKSTVKKLEIFAEPDETDAAVLGRVVDYYHATLKGSPEALGYLRERGLVHEELIDRFRLGYADRTLGYRLPNKNRKAGEVLRAQLQRLGVLRESGHEHFSGSLVIPILGEDGAVLGMYGRKIRNDLRAGTPYHLYLPGPHRGVFNVHALAESREIILCEALIDALTFWCAGFVNVISAYGVEGFTAEHWEALKKYQTDRVLIAYDRDDAGDRAAEKLASEIGARGIEALRVLFPRGMDANEYALKVGPADRSLGVALRAARWMAGPSRRLRDLGDGITPPEVAELYRERAAVLTEPEASAPAAAAAESASDSGAAEAGQLPAEPVSPLAAEIPELLAPVISPAVVEARDDEITLRFGDRQWRIRGLAKNTSLASIKVSIRVLVGAVFFQDTLEVLSARARAAFLKQAADELGQEERVLKADLGKVILKLEELLEAQLREKLDPKKPTYQMTEAEKEEALEFLRDPGLMERIVSDFSRCGVVGEETNKLVGYLAAVSRKLEAPLAIVIQSSTAAGKSSLMDAVLRFVPEEEQSVYSAMTGQSLFYLGAADLQHKVLAIAEEQGALNAAYALKILQSSGELTIASTGKDPSTGRLVTHEYRVKGPVMVMLTTTSIEINEELLNRCLVLTVDEGREQTRAIQRLQREDRTLEGLVAKQERGRLMRLHHNAQRLLMPVHVVNPFAKQLHFADHATRTRRDHAKYLTLIDAITLLHQHQRPVKSAYVGGAEIRYIEVTEKDIETANKLAGQVLSRGLDELSPQTRLLLGLIDEFIARQAKQEGIERSEVRFTRREIRDFTHWGQTQLKVHLSRLEELEYLFVHSGGARKRLVYELCCDYDRNWSGSGRPLVGGQDRPDLLSSCQDLSQLVGDSGKTYTGKRTNGGSYPCNISPLVAKSEPVPLSSVAAG